MLETVSNELLAYQEDRLDSYIELNKTMARAGIVFVGDSIIEFFPLKKYLGRDVPIINRGIAGTDSTWLQEHLHEQVLVLEPEKVFILIGTNDIGLGKSNPEIKENILDILTETHSENPYIKVCLMSVLPVSEDIKYQNTVKVRTNQVIDSLNADLQTIPGIEFIDLATILKAGGSGLADDFTKDGLHLNLLGYQKISQILLEYV
ncbi:SGNH/GDSL hydrolase family protein [Streptococcus parauberis]|uniref:SGNH/GDSL hydrolase family protein n=1 Tax=Streptococcus parauberis TaxID=1348 RepID=UPI0002B9B556|nr:SGNH/GDSL hydrolase family protein [Streptococcus parauberis]EMF49769.1 Lipase/Acylhydrolase family protein [Streptococcus parauberis KRS-02109]PIA85186.1 GDSL-like Lipase/Acylhydrolase [Streptococcus parauberis]PNY21999.1 GDSL-like Lipase/Acylhydrolase [Streptococcus parauberis]UWM87873.1 SGNH/GDSL hydrolase family protein [Streptococcus parauberis]UWM89845.1 SGNH/GDSL hydrolase family protein [Streptococcus parauberis]